MRTFMQLACRAAQNTVLPKTLHLRARALVAILAPFAILLATQNLFATSTAPQTPAAPQKTSSITSSKAKEKPAPPVKRAHRRHYTPKHAAAAVQPVVAPQVPEPPPPNWPVNDKPIPATVVWDSHGLRIDAKNSSLQQILKDVATSTGIKVEGMKTDERVFGIYGPGKARDVLSQLLDGTGYNVVMVGDQGQGTPREILLSAAPKGPAPPAPTTSQASNAANSAAEEEPPEQTPQPPPAYHPGFGPGVPVRTPQQIMQQMQQRQQQMQQNNNPQQNNHPQQ